MSHREFGEPTTPRPEPPPLPDRRFRLTPDGALAGAFLRLVDEAQDPSRNWWRLSPILAAIGLAHYLDEMGWEVRPKP